MDSRFSTPALVSHDRLRSPSRLLRAGLGYLFAAGCLLWVIHDVSFRELAESSSVIHWRWLLLAVACDILAYCCQGVRWRLLLQPLGNLPVLRTTQAIYVGLFSNELLPLRVGELVRGYLVSRWMAAPLVAVLPSILVERFFDGVWLAAGIGLVALFVPLPRNLAQGADILGMVILMATAALAIFFLRYEGRLALPADEEHTGWLRDAIAHMARALKALGRSSGFYAAFVVSLLLLLLQSLALWLVMRGCGIDVPLWIGIAVLLIVHLGTAIPNAPANLGSFQFFCVVGLTLFGVAKPQAAGFSMIAFVVLTAPLWLIGMLALSRSGTSLRRLRQDVRSAVARSGLARDPALN